jgi:pimeloyl-ACP methyl ester carboxylesterase
VIIRGRRIRYCDIGSGPGVILIHGQGGCWQWWLRVMPTIAEHGRIVALDLAGFGDSEPIAIGESVMDEHVATVIGLLDHVGLAKAIIVGHSMGGLIALEVTCDHPARVAGLSLTDAGGANVGPKRLQGILALLRLFNVVFSIAWIPRFVAKYSWLRGVMFAAGVHDGRTLSRALATEIFPRMAGPGFVQTLEAAAVAVNQVRPECVSSPALIVWGARDRILPVSTAHTLASQIPDARLVLLDAVGHCPMVEASGRYSELMVDFIRDPVNGRPIGDEQLPPISGYRRQWWRRHPKPAPPGATSVPGRSVS